MNLKKEMLLAIIFGLVLGIGVAFFVAKTPSFLQNKKENTPVESPTPSPVEEIKDEEKLEILIPSSQSLVFENEVSLSGKAKANHTLIITTPFFEDVIIASDDGTFSSKVKLEEGANEIKVTQIDQDRIEEKSIVVNYSKERL